MTAWSAELHDTLPDALIEGLRNQLTLIDDCRRDIEQLEKRISAWQTQEAACRAISAAPGIGKLTAMVPATSPDNPERKMKSLRDASRYLHGHFKWATAVES